MREMQIKSKPAKRHQEKWKEAARETDKETE